MRRVIALITLLTVVITALPVSAEENECYIICNPKSYVCVRRSPKKGAEETGRLDFGDNFITDGKKKNGFIHVIGITEAGDGWIFAGNVISDKPEKLKNARATVAATGRVMSYRWVNGSKNCWINVGSELVVLAISNDWAVTNKGYIRTQYLEVWYE